jgi:hypothetical protein
VRWGFSVFAVVMLCSNRPLAQPASPLAHATVSCTAANKPGRIRCRAVLELPLASTNKISWSEVRIVSSDPSVTPLRGRLGPFDAESRDDKRVVWAFSVAASEVGERSMRVRMLASLGESALFDTKLDVPVRVVP